MPGEYEVHNPDFARLLAGVRTVAVVGLSDDPTRPSYDVAASLQRFGMKVVPVNPNLTSPILGEVPYQYLKDVPFGVDLVDVFRRSDKVMPVAEDAVSIGAKILWMQLGVVNPEAARYASENGLTVIMNRCLKVEYRSALLR